MPVQSRGPDRNGRPVLDRAIPFALTMSLLVTDLAWGAEAPEHFPEARDKSHQLGANPARRIDGSISDWATKLRTRRLRCDQHAARAAAGDAASLHNLAMCFLIGEGRPRNHIQALALYEQAADQNHAHSHLSVARMYLDGRVAREDHARALKHFRMAAEMGVEGAWIEYGLALPLTDDGQTQACTAFETAASAGQAAGMRLLADCYASGRGKPKDAERAQVLYERSAELGNVNATMKLQGRTLSGTSSAVALREGCDWVIRTAKLRVSRALFTLSACLKETQR